MSASVTKRLVAVLLALTLAGMAGCSSSGGDGDGESSSTTSAEASTTSAPGESAGESTDEASLEQCQALSAVPEDQTALDDAVALFPEDLQADTEQFFTDLVAYVTSFDDETGEPSAPSPEPSEALTAYAEGCSELLGDSSGTGGGTPTFTYESMQISGETAVITYTGECPDGSFPTGTGVAVGFSTEPTLAADLGNGEYELTIDVATGATEDQLVAELGLPDTIEGTCG